MDRGTASEAGWAVSSIDALNELPFQGIMCRPIRARLGITAFGINAFSAADAGAQLIEAHTELRTNGDGQEELYVVVRGCATFTLDTESIDATTGTFVFVRDPSVHRSAVARQPNTVVVVIGGEPGRAFELSPWEYCPEAVPLLRARAWPDAIKVISDRLRAEPKNALLVYGLASVESAAGRLEDAISHLREAIDLDSRLTERAARDPRFDAIQGRL